MIFPLPKALISVAISFLLARCGTTPPTTSQEQNLQATVNTLQTQITAQSASVPATVAPTPTSIALPTSVPRLASTEIPAVTISPVTAATEAPNGTENTIIGKWTYDKTTLDGQLIVPMLSDLPGERLEFFEDDSVEITDFNGVQSKGVYTLSNGNEQIDITVGGEIQKWNLSIKDGELILYIEIFSKINAPAQKKEVFYRRVT